MFVFHDKQHILNKTNINIYYDTNCMLPNLYYQFSLITYCIYISIYSSKIIRLCRFIKQDLLFGALLFIGKTFPFFIEIAHCSVDHRC